MFGGKKQEDNVKVEKLPGPKEIAGLVQNHLINEKKVDADLVRILKSTVRKKEGGGPKAFDIRIFDDSDAAARKVPVKDYNSFEAQPDLVVYDGWFDEATKKVELTEKKKIALDVPLLSQDEIQQKIEGLSEPGSTVFFYMARGPSNGGPLGRGAAVIELTPPVPGKKVKKYTISCADVVDNKPVDKGNKLYDTDKSKDIAKWVKEAHHKRLY